MQYQITTGKKPEGAKLVINIDQIPALAIPPVILIGTGNKAGPYKKFLEKNLFSNPMVTNTFVKMHDMAITNSGMHLNCKCRHQKFHAQVLKELFEEHADTFTSLISYLIPNSENKANLDKEEGEEVPQSPPMMAMGTQTTLDQLNVPGADQLRALIAADMEEERLKAEGCPDIVDAEIVSETIRTPQVTQTAE